MIRFRPLFQVELFHDYFLNRGNVMFEAQPEEDRNALKALYSVGNFLEIFADEPTVEKLAGHKMIFRTTGTGFLVAVRTDPTINAPQPSIPLATDFRLTFAVRIKDPRFANYTELGPTGTGFYRFGNDSHNAVAESAFLSHPVDAFDSSKRYVAGETYSQASGATFNLFRALRDTGPSPSPTVADWERIPSDTWNSSINYAKGAVVLFANRVYRALINNPGTNLNNGAEWQLLNVLVNQYVTTADTALLVSGLLNLDLSDILLPQATIRLFRSNELTVAIEQTFVAKQGVLGEVQVDLRGLRSGYYRLEVLDDALAIVAGRSLSVYLSPAAKIGGWFGAIDIGMGDGDSALLNPDGTLRSPVYTLRFLNRATRWRYIFPSAQPVGSGSEVAPEAGNESILVTANPRPLTRFGTGVRLQANNASRRAALEEVLLPEPEINRIRRQNAQWYSEIHLSNLPLGA
jgi:hypothetical protein